jgi:hypothetical protein
VRDGWPCQALTWVCPSFFGLLHLDVNRWEEIDVYRDSYPTSDREPTLRGSTHAEEAWGHLLGHVVGEAHGGGARSVIRLDVYNSWLP